MSDPESPTPAPSTPLDRALGHPALHLIVGLAFLVVFSWPLFAFDVPFNTWSFLYVAWGVSIGLLYAMSQGTDPTEDDEQESSASPSITIAPPSH